MVAVLKGCVSHDGVMYTRGEVISNLSKEEERRLLDLGVCVECGQTNANNNNNNNVNNNVENNSEDPSQAANALNLNFNPEDSIVGK